MRYRTFVLLSALLMMVVSALFLYLMNVLVPTRPVNILVALIFIVGVVILNVVSLLLAWRNNQEALRRIGFRRW